MKRARNRRAGARSGARVLSIAVWILGVAAILSMTAAFIRPTVAWPLHIAAVFLPATCLSLLFLAVLCLFWRLRIAAILAAAVALFGLGRHVSPARIHSPTPGADDITLLTYNAPKVPDDDRARREVTRLVAQVEPDIIALQEAVVWSMKRAPDVLLAHNKFRPLIDSMGYRAMMPPAGGPTRYSYTHWKPPVLTQTAPVSQEEIALAFSEEGDPSHSVLRTELENSGRTFVLYNVHLPSHGSKKPWTHGKVWSIGAWAGYLREIREGFELRERQVLKIRELIASETLPVVLAGDFNGTPDSWTYRQLAGGLTDVFRVRGSGWGGTYHADRPLVRIDFVLVGPDFEPVGAVVPSPHPYSSDHRPLVARFRWRAKQSGR